MSEDKKNQILFSTAAALGAGSAAWGVTRYKQQKSTAIARLTANSEIIETSRGPIETAVRGEGPVVSMVHGGGGGYDRFLIYAHPEAGFKYVTFSRPGYLRTPLSVGRTAEQQADALAALLDKLGIEKTAVQGISAGGPVSVQFALRHPDRCWGLIMASAINAPLRPLLSQMMPVTRRLLRYDGLTWLGLNRLALFAARPKLARQVRGNRHKQQQLKATLDALFPTSLRLDGLLNDLNNFQNTPDYPLEQITVPTLVIHGTADQMVPFVQGQASAARIPNAEFVIAVDGMHLCLVSHQEQITPAIIDFLRRHVPA